MIALEPIHHEHLCALARAGADGLHVDGHQVNLAACARLEAWELASIVTGDHVRAYITARGAAFYQRSAA